MNEKAQQILTKLLDNQPSTIKELVKTLDSHINTVTNNLKELQKTGLVKTIPMKGYGKNYLLTTKGHDIARRFKEIEELLGKQ